MSSLHLVTQDRRDTGADQNGGEESRCTHCDLECRKDGARLGELDVLQNEHHDPADDEAEAKTPMK